MEYAEFLAVLFQYSEHISFKQQKSDESKLYYDTTKNLTPKMRDFVKVK